MSNPEKASAGGKSTWGIKGSEGERLGYPKAPKGIEIRGGKVSGAGLIRDANTGKLTVPERG